MTERCDIYWGTHGCHLDAGHYGVCQCGSRDDVCSQFHITGAISADGSVPGIRRDAYVEGGWTAWFDSWGRANDSA